MTDKVLHATRTPLLVTRASEPGAVSTEVKVKTIIVPLDGSPLSEQVLPHVVTLARPRSLKTILLRVIPSLGEYHRYLNIKPLDSYSKIYYGPYEQFSREASAQAKDHLYTVSQALGLQGLNAVETCLVSGHVAETIIDQVRSTPHSLVTMTTHGRSGLGRWVLGSVTDRVVLHARSPVFIVRALENGGP